MTSTQTAAQTAALEAFLDAWDAGAFAAPAAAQDDAEDGCVVMLYLAEIGRAVLIDPTEAHEFYQNTTACPSEGLFLTDCIRFF
jgi:hypothetical protein